MGSYLPLFMLSVEHEFFPGDVCSALDFVPTPQSEVLLKKASLLTRSTSNSVHVFYDADQAESLDLYTGNPEEPFDLQYRVFSKDLFFKNYSEAVSYKENAILYFDSANAQQDEEGCYRLHAADSVSESDLLLLDSPLLNDILSKKDRLVCPLFIVNIGISNSGDRAKKYTLKFKARETIWKYYLLGNMARKDSYITDLSNKTEFEFTGSESLLDKKVALTFRSKTPIPLRERLDCRFQLKEKGPGNGKILIKRLPVAAATQISKESINGKESVISEIYVNC